MYIDLEPEEAGKRFMQRPETRSRFEARGLGFFKNVHKRYADLLPSLPNVFIIDGNLETARAADLVTKKILVLIASKKI